jgi:adenylate cyclase
MLGKLVPCGGGVPVPLMKPKLVVGRHPDCDITVPCKTVSSRHCELQFRDSFWWVRDLDSKNGTKVNGVRCAEQRLAQDDILGFGRQRYVLTYASAAQQARPPAANEDIESLALNFLIGREEPAAARPAPQAQRPRTQKGPGVGLLLPCGGGDPIALVPPEALIGRSPACDICLRMSTVSGKHCKLTWRDGYWFVEDLNSSNGTSVNGVRCTRQCLPPESVLGLAQHRFVIHYTPTADGPPPSEENIFAQGLLEKLGLAQQLGAGEQAAGAGAEEDADLKRRRYNLEPDEEP